MVECNNIECNHFFCFEKKSGYLSDLRFILVFPLACSSILVKSLFLFAPKWEEKAGGYKRIFVNLKMEKNQWKRGGLTCYTHPRAIYNGPQTPKSLQVFLTDFSDFQRFYSKKRHKLYIVFIAGTTILWT